MESEVRSHVETHQVTSVQELMDNLLVLVGIYSNAVEVYADYGRLLIFNATIL